MTDSLLGSKLIVTFNHAFGLFSPRHRWQWDFDRGDDMQGAPNTSDIYCLPVQRHTPCTYSLHHSFIHSLTHSCCMDSILRWGLVGISSAVGSCQNYSHASSFVQKSSSGVKWRKRRRRRHCSCGFLNPCDKKKK
ncbi:hypothetical protein BHM03_00040809 [Ensete ventricosum]|nr:hypothetical protein BHM03_00040809 [Ensete ventricosum]